LRHVARVLERFRASDPASWRRALDANGEYFLYSLHVQDRPESLELLVDESFHHLRSVLDHLVAATVESRGKKVTRDHGFPILRRRPTSVEEKERIRKMLKHVPAEAQSFIDSVQPYHLGKGANRHPLAILWRLNNSFKHHSLHLLAFQLQFPDVPGIIQPPAPPTGRDDGDVFAMVPISIDVEKRFEPHIFVQIGFRKRVLGLENIGIATINDVYNYVRDEVILKAIRMKNPPRRL
jgi:hypothetical protein